MKKSLCKVPERQRDGKESSNERPMQLQMKAVLRSVVPVDH
jgi:hypothetical protein